MYTYCPYNFHTEAFTQTQKHEVLQESLYIIQLHSCLSNNGMVDDLK